jgi:hypothetical protein
MGVRGRALLRVRLPAALREAPPEEPKLPADERDEGREPEHEQHDTCSAPAECHDRKRADGGQENPRQDESDEEPRLGEQLPVESREVVLVHGGIVADLRERAKARGREAFRGCSPARPALPSEWNSLEFWVFRGDIERE